MCRNVLRALASITAMVGIAACGSYGAAVNSGPASTVRTASAARAASPWTDIAPDQQAIDPIVLSPATVLPVARLCSVMYGFATAEGLYGPPFCVDGSINEVAWGEFSSVTPHVLAAGRPATTGEVDGAIEADAALGATAAQEYWAYLLAAAYYGWTFTPSPVCVELFHLERCQLPPPAYSAAQSAVTVRVLPPATVLPSAGLCSSDLRATANGNWDPLFCGKSLNAVAWREYAKIGPHIIGAGKSATAAQVTAALKADFVQQHSTNIEELDAYQLAAAYYAWRFSPNPACEFLYKQAACY